MSKAKSITYWTTTILISLALLSGGITELIRQPDTVRGTELLGYPAYICTILGFWKLLGAIALLAPGMPRVEEWAYAGIFFDLTGASASHTFAGDYGPGYFHVIVPLVIAAIAFISWALRPQSRIIGVLCSAGRKAQDGANLSTAT
jgi:hypothetical protein